MIGYIAAYQQANDRIFTHFAEAEFAQPHKIPDKALGQRRDLKALEYVWRFMYKKSILTIKLHLLLHLIKTTPDGYHHFVNHKLAKLKAYIAWYSILFVLCFN